MSKELDKHIDNMFRESFTTYEVPGKASNWSQIKGKVRMTNLKQFAFGHLNIFNALISVGVVTGIILSVLKLISMPTHIHSIDSESENTEVYTETLVDSAIIKESVEMAIPQLQEELNIENAIIEEKHRGVQEETLETDLLPKIETSTGDLSNTQTDSNTTVRKELVVIKPVVKKVVMQKSPEYVKRDTVVKYKRLFLFNRKRRDND